MKVISKTLVCEELRKAIISHWPRYKNVHIKYDYVATGALSSVISLISKKRLKLALNVVKKYQSNAIIPFEPVIYSRLSDVNSIGFGPLVERNGNSLVLIDGVHRSVAANRLGLREIYVLIIEAEIMPPAVGPIRKLETIIISQSPKTRNPLYQGRGLANFRPSALFTETAASCIMKNIMSKRL